MGVEITKDIEEEILIQEVDLTIEKQVEEIIRKEEETTITIVEVGIETTTAMEEDLIRDTEEEVVVQAHLLIETEMGEHQEEEVEVVEMIDTIEMCQETEEEDQEVLIDGDHDDDDDVV